MMTFHRTETRQSRGFGPLAYEMEYGLDWHTICGEVPVNQTYLTASVRVLMYFLTGIHRKFAAIQSFVGICIFYGLDAFATTVTQAATPTVKTIGPEALLPLQSSQQFSSAVNDAPDDGSVQNYNPPIFTWIYNGDNPWGITRP